MINKRASIDSYSDNNKNRITTATKAKFEKLNDSC